MNETNLDFKQLDLNEDNINTLDDAYSFYDYVMNNIKDNKILETLNYIEKLILYLIDKNKYLYIYIIVYILTRYNIDSLRLNIILNLLYENKLYDKYIDGIKLFYNKIQKMDIKDIIDNLLIEHIFSLNFSMFLYDKYKEYIGIRYYLNLINYIKNSKNNTIRDNSKKMYKLISPMFNFNGIYRDINLQNFCLKKDYKLKNPIIINNQIIKIPYKRINFEDICKSNNNESFYKEIYYLTISNLTVNYFPKYLLNGNLGKNKLLKDKKYVFDLDWLYESINYISSLSIKDKFILYSYTTNGYRIINNYLLNNIDYLNDHLFSKKQIKEKKNDTQFEYFIDKFFYEFTKIFKLKKDKDEEDISYDKKYSNNINIRNEDNIKDLELINFSLFFNASYILVKAYSENKKDNSSNIDYYLVENIEEGIKNNLYLFLNEIKVNKDIDMYICNHLKEYYYFIVKNKYIFNKKFWFECIEDYKNDLNRIFDNSNPIKNNIVVYRGIRSIFFEDKINNLFITNTFLSTSLNLNIALNFSGEKPKIIKRFILNKGTKALFLPCISAVPYESEILLGLNNKFQIIKNENIEYIDYPDNITEDNNIKNEICGFNNIEKVKVITLKTIN